MSRWQAFRALGTGDRRLVAEAGFLLCMVSFGVSVLRFRTMTRLLSRYVRFRDGSFDRLSTDEVRRVTWAVMAVSRRLPMRPTCLVEALAAQAMLRRRGCASQLRFGVRTTPLRLQRRAAGAESGDLAAHAWIEHRGIVVLGQLDNLLDYEVLAAPRSR